MGDASSKAAPDELIPMFRREDIHVVVVGGETNGYWRIMGCNYQKTVSVDDWHASRPCPRLGVRGAAQAPASDAARASAPATSIMRIRVLLYGLLLRHGVRGGGDGRRVTSAAEGSSRSLHPPPRFSTSSTAAVMRRPRICTAVS